MRKALLLGVALLGFATTANAAVVDNLGINPTSATGDFSSGLLGINGTGAGAFTDQVLFQLVGGPQFLTIASATNVYPASDRLYHQLHRSRLPDRRSYRRW